jgi:hypothetical protein
MNRFKSVQFEIDWDILTHEEAADLTTWLIAHHAEYFRRETVRCPRIWHSADDMGEAHP